MKISPPVKKKKSAFEIGVNLRVTQCFDKGGRNYMEDFSKYYFEKDSQNNQSVVFAFFGVFDGHGGTEAADLANECLLEEIKSQEEFWSQDDHAVLQAIRQGFLRTHKKMVEERDKWPLTPSGFKSTAGTTASIAIIRNRKLYVGHVGDSAVVIGYCATDSKDATTDNWCGSALTVEHKPDHPDERRRIEAHGGSVRRKAGIHRVVWNRPKSNRPLTATASTTPVVAEYEEIPFLAVARSLGDLWSFDPETQQFHVSPEPDISVYELRPNEHRCLIIGSDGLWNVMKPETAVELVRLCERETESRVFSDTAVSPSFFYHPAGTLVQFALERCQTRNVRADNVTALVVMVDPPGKPMTQLRQERRRLLFSRLGLDDREEEGVRRLLVESERASGKDACSSPTMNVNPSPSLPSPVIKSPRGKSSPALSILRHTLQGAAGFPTLVDGWTEACWREMLAYCRQSGLLNSSNNPPLDPKCILDHLMDMDAKYRKEALQAVPTVLSMKKAFARDYEMTICLNQIPLLSREWTQLVVMSSSNPSSPTSPSSSLSPPILTPVGPPSPPACKRWVERRDKILSYLYQILGRKLPSELSDDVQECMKQHIAREVSQRVRVSCPLDPATNDELVDDSPTKEALKEDTWRKRRPTRSLDEETEITKRKPVRTDDEEMEGLKRMPTRSLDDETETVKRKSSRTGEIEGDGSKRRSTRLMDEEGEGIKNKASRSMDEEVGGMKRRSTRGIGDETEGVKRRPTRSMDEVESPKKKLLQSRDREGVGKKLSKPADNGIDNEKKSLQKTQTDEDFVQRRMTRSMEAEKTDFATEGMPSVNQSSAAEPMINGSPSKPSLRRVGRCNGSTRTRCASDSSVSLKISPPLEGLPSPIAIEKSEEVNENGVERTTVVPWKSHHRRRFDAPPADKNEKAVDDLMEKLVVVVQPTPEDLKNWPTRRFHSDSVVTKPRPVILPAVKNASKSPAKVLKKRKSESDVKQIPKVPELNFTNNYKPFYQRVVTDEKAEAKLEEVMKSLRFTCPQYSPPPAFLSTKPMLDKPPQDSLSVPTSSEFKFQSPISLSPGTELKSQSPSPYTGLKSPNPSPNTDLKSQSPTSPSPPKRRRRDSEVKQLSSISTPETKRTHKNPDTNESSLTTGRRSLRLRSNKF